MDLSGLSLASESEGWIDPSEGIPPTLKAILCEAGRFYAPFMVANDAAVSAGKKEVQCALDGGRTQWNQPSFKYQAKCLKWMRDDFAKLGQTDQQWVRGVRRGTGCEVLLGQGGGGSRL